MISLNSFYLKSSIILTSNANAIFSIVARVELTLPDSSLDILLFSKLHFAASSC